MQRKEENEQKVLEKTLTSSDLYEVYGCKNLRFMLDIFTALNLTPYSFGQMTDNTLSSAQALRAQLKKDDMKISRAKQIVSIITEGRYMLEIAFTDENGAPMPPAPTGITIEAPDYHLSLPKKLRENFRKRTRALKMKIDPRKNLAFLKFLLVQNDISQRGLARKIGLSAGAVETWFRRDDVAISHLFKIKEALGLGISFSLKACKKEKNEGEK